MFKLITDYQKNKNGNVALTFAVILVPAIIAIGAAVDYSRLTSVHNKLQSAADAAALSSALAYSRDETTNYEQVGNEAFNQNAYENETVMVSKHTATLTGNNSVLYTASGKLDPMFAQIFGYPKLEFYVKSEASLKASQGLELAIAFDSTNSMAQGTSWQNAMSTVENSLENMKNLSGNDNFYVSLVPFSDRVNIGTVNKNWVRNTLPNSWKGCVEPREEIQGQFNWALDDDTPENEPFTASKPGAKLGNSNNVISCPNVAITGPTNIPDDISKIANSMTSGGSGRFDIGLSWAWRLLSPKWSTNWGVNNYPTADENLRKKKIIFMSDGKTTTYEHEMSEEADWGWNKGSIVGFEHIVELCRKIKNENIEIYVLQANGNSHATDYFKQCASSPSHYYSMASSSDVTIAFTDILNEISTELRIIR